MRTDFILPILNTIKHAIKILSEPRPDIGLIILDLWQTSEKLRLPIDEIEKSAHFSLKTCLGIFLLSVEPECRNAMQIFTSLLREKPGDPQTLYYIAETYFKQKDFHTARLNIEQAIRKNKNHILPRFCYAKVLQVIYNQATDHIVRDYLKDIPHTSTELAEYMADNFLLEHAIKKLKKIAVDLEHAFLIDTQKAIILSLERCLIHQHRVNFFTKTPTPESNRLTETLNSAILFHRKFLAEQLETAPILNHSTHKEFLDEFITREQQRNFMISFHATLLKLEFDFNYYSVLTEKWTYAAQIQWNTNRTGFWVPIQSGAFEQVSSNLNNENSEANTSETISPLNRPPGSPPII